MPFSPDFSSFCSTFTTLYYFRATASYSTIHQPTFFTNFPTFMRRQAIARSTKLLFSLLFTTFTRRQAIGIATKLRAPFLLCTPALLHLFEGAIEKGCKGAREQGGKGTKRRRAKGEHEQRGPARLDRGGGLRCLYYTNWWLLVYLAVE